MKICFVVGTALFGASIAYVCCEHPAEAFVCAFLSAIAFAFAAIIKHDL
jgi:hypothetical protein